MKLFNFPEETFSAIVTNQPNTTTQLNTVITGLGQIVLTQDTNPPSDESIVVLRVMAVMAAGYLFLSSLTPARRSLCQLRMGRREQAGGEVCDNPVTSRQSLLGPAAL